MNEAKVNNLRCKQNFVRIYCAQIQEFFFDKKPNIPYITAYKSHKVILCYYFLIEAKHKEHEVL